MSWYEFNDMYQKAQEVGNYKIFVFDVKDSKKHIDNNRLISDLKKLLSEIYSKIKDIELKENRKILHTSKYLNGDDYRGDTVEPFCGMGDLIAFTVLRGSISDNEIYSIFKNSKRHLNLEEMFHHSSGFYETDNYLEGNEKYFRGYCIAYLESKAKEQENLI